MIGKIVIDAEGCKGCGLCALACPKHCISLSTRTNRKGFCIAVTNNVDCIGCAMCALMCPDAVIEVWRDEQSDLEPKPNKPEMVGRSR